MDGLFNDTTHNTMKLRYWLVKIDLTKTHLSIELHRILK